jgi:hypothetical protein
MINEGMIFLFDSDCLLIGGRKYSSPGKRKSIIKEWGRLYAAMFCRCFIQIAPVTNHLLVGDRGLNIKKGYGYNIDGKYVTTYRCVKPPIDADMTGANIKTHIYITS